MKLGIAGGVVALLALAYSSVFTVYQTQQALAGLGQPVRVVTEPGLHFKAPPLIEQCRDRQSDSRSRESGAGGDRVRPEAGGGRVRALPHPRIRYASTRRSATRVRTRSFQSCSTPRSAAVWGEATSTHVVRDERGQLMARVREQLDKEAQVYGTPLMSASGAPTCRTRTRGGLSAHADRTAARGGGISRAREPEVSGNPLQGHCDVPCWWPRLLPSPNSCVARATVNAIEFFAEAFGRDPDFFAFYRSMQAYEA